MKRGRMGWLAIVLLLAGCEVTTHRSLHTDSTTSTTGPATYQPAGLCPQDKLIWQGTLNEDQSRLALCKTGQVATPSSPNIRVYRLYRRYTDGTTVHVDAAGYDVGLTPRSVGGGFWLRTETEYHQVAEGSETAIYEVDTPVAFQGFLPSFISGVTMSDGYHVNHTREHFSTSP